MAFNLGRKDTVLNLIYQGATRNEIANQMGICVNTVTHYARSLGRKRGGQLIKSSVREMSEPERAYVGAMIDGEGCVFAPRGTNTTWRVAIANTDPEIMSALLRCIGAGLLRPAQGVSRKKHHKQGYILYLRTEETKDVARQCYQYSFKLQRVSL